MKKIILLTIVSFECSVVFAALRLSIQALLFFAGIAEIFNLWIDYKTLTQIIS